MQEAIFEKVIKGKAKSVKLKDTEINLLKRPFRKHFAGNTDPKNLTMQIRLIKVLKKLVRYEKGKVSQPTMKWLKGEIGEENLTEFIKTL